MVDSLRLSVFRVLASVLQFFVIASAWSNPESQISWAQLGRGVSENDVWRLPAIALSQRSSSDVPDVSSHSKSSKALLRHARETDAGAVAELSLEEDAQESRLASRVHAEVGRLTELVASVSDESEAYCARLERGLLMLREAASSRRTITLETVLRAIGLQPAATTVANRALYGELDATHALPTPKSSDSAQYVGLQSSPSQFACLLEKAGTWNVTTALELGTGSGWASAAIATYLASKKGGRAAAGHFDFHTLDNTDRRLDCASRAQDGLGVRFHLADAAQVGGMEDLPHNFDLCIIDHKVTVAAVQDVFRDLRNRCRYFVLHGVSSDLAPQDFRKYWEDLKAQRPNSTQECTGQPSQGTHHSSRPSKEIGKVMGYGIFQA